MSLCYYLFHFVSKNRLPLVYFGRTTNLETFWISLGATKSVDSWSWPNGRSQGVSRDNLTTWPLDSCVYTCLHFQCFVLCRSVKVWVDWGSVFIKFDTDTDSWQQLRLVSFYKSFIGNAKCYKCYLPASGWWSCYRRSWNNAQVHGMYLGFLGFDIWCPYSRVCGVLGSWDPGILASATLDFAPLCFLLPGSSLQTSSIAKQWGILRKGEVDKLVQEMFSYATVSWEARTKGAKAWKCQMFQWCARIQSSSNDVLLGSNRRICSKTPGIPGMDDFPGEVPWGLLFWSWWVVSKNVCLCRHRVKQVDEQYLRDEFNAADGDGNGVLDVDELNELLKKMGYITDATWSTKDTNKR